MSLEKNISLESLLTLLFETSLPDVESYEFLIGFGINQYPNASFANF